MPKKLRTYVHAYDSDGVAWSFGPGDDLPEWAVNAITNPKAWADDPEPEAVEPVRPAKNAAKEHWVEFAKAVGVAVSDEDTKADIIAAVGE